MEINPSDKIGDWVVLEKQHDGSYSKVFTIHHKSDEKKLNVQQNMDNNFQKFEKREKSATKNSNKLNRTIDKSPIASSKLKEMDSMFSEQQLLKPKSSPKKSKLQTKGNYKNISESFSNLDCTSKGYLHLESNKNYKIIHKNIHDNIISLRNNKFLLNNQKKPQNFIYVLIL